MNLLTIVFLLQLALAILTANPQSEQAQTTASQAVAIASEALAQATTTMTTTPSPVVCYKTGFCTIGNYDGTGANTGDLDNNLREQYPINPVSPCGTLPCKE